MKLWLLTQCQVTGYDKFDSAVVAAETEAEAKSISPSGEWENSFLGSWATSPEHVTAQLIGEAAPGIRRGVVLASYNAG